MNLKVITATAMLSASFSYAFPQTYDTNNVVVETFVGSGLSGYVDGVGQRTMFDYPSAIAADSASNRFVLDTGNSRIREVAPDGTVSTLAGGGSQSTGIGTNVDLSSMRSANFSGLAIDSNDTIWFVASSSARLYRITSSASVTFANLSFSSPAGVCADPMGNIYISDWQGNRIYRYSANGTSTVFAGSGNYSYKDGNGIFTAFASPTALAADQAGNIYVWDSGNDLVRKVDTSQNVTTVAGKYRLISEADGVGTNASFGLVGGICADDGGNLIVACMSSIRRVSATGTVTTLAGNFSQTGYADGPGPVAKFWSPGGVCVSQGKVFVADTFNQ